MTGRLSERKVLSLARSAMARTIAGNTRKAAADLVRLGDNVNEAMMFGVCCTFGRTARKALDQLGHPPGRPVLPEDLKVPAASEDPASEDALLFLVAYANGDVEGCAALYRQQVAAGVEHQITLVSTLLAEAANLARRAAGGRP